MSHSTIWKDRPRGTFFEDSGGNVWQVPSSCPFCGTEREPHLVYSLEPRYYGFTTSVQPFLGRCPSCALEYTYPRLIQLSTTAEQAARAHAQEGDALEVREGFYREEQYGLFLDRLEARRARGTLLDVGCGPGRFLQLAHKRGWAVQGLDMRAEHVARVQRAGFPAWQGDISSVQLAPDFFDVITMTEVMEHLPHPVEALSNVNRWLKPGGLLLATTPDPASIEAKIERQRWAMLYVNSHYCFYPFAVLQRLLAQTGFEVVDRVLWLPAGNRIKDLAKFVLAGVLRRNVVGHVIIARKVSAL